MNISSVLQIIKIIEKEGFERIKINKSENQKYNITIITKKNNKIEILSDEEEKKLFEKILSIDETTNEGEIDSAILDTNHEIENTFREWVLFLEVNNNSDNSKIKEKEKLYKIRIELLRKRLEQLKIEKKETKRKKIKKLIKEDIIKQEILIILNKIILLKTHKITNNKTNNKIRRISPTIPSQ